MIGRKIGLTSEAVQRQLGVDQPEFVDLWNSRCVQGEAHLRAVQADLFLQKRVWVESPLLER